MMKKNIVIIHYNTPHLTECLVRSINLFVKDVVIYIFDNSTEKPFTAKFENVTILDNTKGQIINFDKWLEAYPHKNRSHGRVNKWGSAKHCYSVEKCMELINDNFILLDSDVLLKRDISNLFIDKSIYCGEVITQPNSSIKRVLPFICFINVKMCKENNVHYFDDNYMHGLCKNFNSDRYDTGANLFLASTKYPHTDIKWREYVLHYGHGSWDKKGEKPKFNENEWLRINKRFWSMEKNKKVVYTCITGGYDTLRDPNYITEGFDYICFTDNKDIKSEIWQIKPLPKETEGLSQVKKQRFVKINPHLLLKDYDFSIWVDGNVALKDNLNEFVKNTMKDDCSVYVPQHPSRRCIYDEERIVVRMRKDKSENTRPQIERYKKEGFPPKYGLLQSNIMLRKHNNGDCIKLMETWWKELKNGSHRDQLSFNYASWKNSDVKVIYMDKNICKSKYFFWSGAHQKKNSTVDYGDGYESLGWSKKLPNSKINSTRHIPTNVKKNFHALESRKRMSTHNIRIY